MTIIRRPRLQILPLALRFARPLAQLAGLTSLTPPLGTSAPLSKRSGAMIVTSWWREKKEVRTQIAFPTGFSAGRYPASSLRCGDRQGSSLRSDELREQQNSSLRP